MKKLFVILVFLILSILFQEIYEILKKNQRKKNCYYV